jgi:hypothetical protein
LAKTEAKGDRIDAVTGVLSTRGFPGQRLRKLYGRLTHGGQWNKNQAKAASICSSA